MQLVDTLPDHLLRLAELGQIAGIQQRLVVSLGNFEIEQLTGALVVQLDGLDVVFGGPGQDLIAEAREDRLASDETGLKAVRTAGVIALSRVVAQVIRSVGAAVTVQLRDTQRNGRKEAGHRLT